MKNLTFFLAFLVFGLPAAYTQIPQAIKYQAVARGMEGNSLNNQDISVKISILTGIGEVIYSEIHHVSTNEFGLFTLEIGQPDEVLLGDFSTIQWGTADHFLKLEMDENGGEDYRFLGISQFLSVPYASISNSLILSDANGNKYQVMVDTSGNLFTTPVETGWQCGMPFMDQRDGRAYPTVQIGDRCWMAENLNYYTDNSYCYQDNPSYCDEYGRLYDWFTAITICPAGWHLPSETEIELLEGEADSQYPPGDPIWNNSGWRGFDAGKNLKSTSGWNNGNGVDLYGFGFLPGGKRLNTGGYSGRLSAGYIWSADETNATISWYHTLYNNHDDAYKGTSVKETGMSVRCIKDSD